MTKYRIALIAALIAPGCASLAPREERQTQFVENVTATKATAYNRALAYIGKSWGNANSAIKMKDPESGQIVVKGNAGCNVLRQAGDLNDYSVSFSLDFQAKDNRVRLLFEDLEMIDQNGQSFQYAYGQMTNKGQVSKIRPCLDTVKAGFMKAINSSGDAW